MSLKTPNGTNGIHIVVFGLLHSLSIPYTNPINELMRLDL